jgi:diguanylate cyclase (GGDEF)-like protein
VKAARRGVWASIAVLLVTGGTLAAILAASSVAHSDHGRERLAFKFSAAQIASTLKLAIQHEEDLVVSGRAFVVSNPDASVADFARWGESVGALQRYPELQDIGLLVFVRASQLGAFRAQMLAHPILPQSRQPAESRGVFEILPQGNRPYYCFAAAGLVRQQVAILPPGLDYCAIEPLLLSARDSGRSSYVPFEEGGTTTLAVQTPIYSTGVPPATVAARRATFLGWLGESLVPQVVLRTALQGHPRIAVTFRYHYGSSDVVFQSGARAAGAERSTIELHNGWSVESYGVVPGGGIFGDGHALTLLLGGTALALLLGALTFVLGTGRTRALSLVREKTRELSYQALHDGLTGLPNRSLVIQRAQEMLTRSGIVTAALYVDLDGFKLVNDKFGHAAGDELLKVLATRLRNAVRDEDIVGRLGGDEFVVLLESAVGESRPDLVAERLIELSRRPIALGDRGCVVTVSASVGIAIGRRRTVDALLRDADLALYAAKAAGKDRYILFEPDLQGDAPELPGEASADDAAPSSGVPAV